MIKSVLTLIALLAASAAFTLGQTTQLSGPRKEPTNDVPTPGVLLPLRSAPPEQLVIDDTGIELPPNIAWDVDPTTGAQFRRGELLVRFSDSADTQMRAQALRRTGGARVVRGLPEHWELARFQSDYPLDRARADLLASNGVEEVSLNYRATTQQLRPNDENYPLQWNFDAIGMPNAWQINPGANSDVIVAVVDTGLNIVNDTITFFSPFVGQVSLRFSMVPDLVTSGRIVSPYDFIYDDALPVDLGGHGTHVAGTIAQETNNNIGVAGVAYNVRLMPLKVISGGSFISWDDIFNPGHQGGSASIVAEAIRYAADNGAKVINLSLGSLGPQPVVRDAIQYAVGQGAFVAIAAGNSGDTGNPVMYPAAYAAEIDGAMTVGAVNRERRRARYSGFHSYVEICAPGGESSFEFDFERNITQVGYEEASTLSFLTGTQKLAALFLGFRPRFDRFELRPFQGTSMATPHVSGVAALLYSQGIRNPAAIEEAIKRFAMPLDTTPEECGAGFVDARRALRGLGLAR